MAPYPDYPIPDNEVHRLRELQRYNLLDGGMSTHLDKLVELVADVFNIPIALVSLIDADRQWFLARYGLGLHETSRQAAFCAHTITNESGLVITDALKDERFSNNPLVIGNPFIRFYAGAPLTSKNGYKIGTLCVIDHVSRTFESRKIEILRKISDIVMHEIDTQEKSLFCPITKVYLKSVFCQFATREMRMARENHYELCLLNLDMDNFSQPNNRWGHHAADSILHDVCATIKNRLKTEDLVGRIIDDEFSVLLVNVNEEEGLWRAEEIRRELSALPGIYDHSDYRPRISGGFTRMLPADRDVTDLFNRAERALWIAKGNGRNQIVRLV